MGCEGSLGNLLNHFGSQLTEQTIRCMRDWSIIQVTLDDDGLMALGNLLAGENNRAPGFFTLRIPHNLEVDVRLLSGELIVNNFVQYRCRLGLKFPPEESRPQMTEDALASSFQEQLMSDYFVKMFA